jgi:ketosteroid isomerase-like protein
MSQENIDLVSEVTEVIAQRNVERLIELTDPEVEWHSVFAGLGEGGVCRGHGGIRRYLSDLGDVWESMRMNIDQALSIGAVVLMVGRLHYHGRGSGVETEAPLGIVAKFRNGRIIYMRAFQEPEQAFLSVGLSG